MSKIKRWIVDRPRLALSHCPRAWPNLRLWGRKRSGRARRVEAAIAILSTCDAAARPVARFLRTAPRPPV